MRSSRLALVILAATACGGDPPYTDLANICASPRAGTADKQGTVNDEKKFIRSWEDALYLWYRELPNVDPGSVATVDAYFAKLITPVRTATNNPKDRFHFIIPTAVWDQQSQGGVSAGYGVAFAVLAPSVPRQAVVAYTQPNTEGGSKLARGAQVVTVDGVDLVNSTGQANVDILNGGLFPSALNQTHTFEVIDVGSTARRTVTLTSTTITETPVQNVHLIPNTHVGYILFNDHIATAEQELIDAVNTLKTQGATDLVLDMRYNGGGFLDIASELAFMVAGPQRTSGKIFEKLAFNDKYPTNDPVTGQPLTPTPFESSAAGFLPSVPRGAALPHLDLPRVFVLTSGSTCSASESVINSLMGVDVQVIAIGGVTCGKPYGFYPQDNCGNTYFSIEFQGVNNKGFGDYADGFIPGGGGSNPAGCGVADDFGHQLGDPAEAQLAAALAFATSGACPKPAAAALTERGLRGNAQLFKPEWRMNRILRR